MHYALLPVASNGVRAALGRALGVPVPAPLGQILLMVSFSGGVLADLQQLYTREGAGKRE